MSDQFYTVIDGEHQLVTPIESSAGAGDAHKILRTDSAGKIDETFMPDGIAADTTVLNASENLSAGDQVNLWNDGGTMKVRKANATDNSKPSDGFVKSSVTSGDPATVYHGGIVSGLSGLTLGADYFLSKTSGGGVTADVSGHTSAGNVIQRVGKARSATEIVYARGIPVKVA